jgi:predicted ribosomally synthesized peptide with SipW-like signal peptide
LVIVSQPKPPEIRKKTTNTEVKIQTMNKQILVSLMIIGVVGAVASGTTLAEFTDTESSTDNTFQAGALDLTIDWNQTYNGPGEYSYAQNSTARNCQTLEEVDGEVLEDPRVTCTMFALTDVKPGDMGEATVSLHLEDNPGYMWTRFNIYNDFDNNCNEPEGDVDNTCGDDVEGSGELDDETHVTVWVDDARSNETSEPIPGVEAGNNKLDYGERVLYSGSAAGLDELDGGMMLDSDSTTSDNEAFDAGKSYIAIKWELPYETGNIVQTDSFMMDMDFAVQQERHTGTPQSPFTQPNNS